MTAVSAVFRLFVLIVYVAAAIFIGLATITMAINPFVGLLTLLFLGFAAYDITKGECP